MLYVHARLNRPDLDQSPTTASTSTAFRSPTLAASPLSGRDAADHVMRWFSLRIAKRPPEHHVVERSPAAAAGVQRRRSPPAPLCVVQQLERVGRLERLRQLQAIDSLGPRSPLQQLSATRLTRLIGMLNATPLLLPLCEAMAVLMRSTSRQG